MKFNKPKFWDRKGKSFLTIILFPVSLIYLLAIYLKSKIVHQNKFKIPIVCIGNIYIGGTGKTPISIEIFKIFKSIKKNPAFIKKYYPYLIDEKNLLENFGKVFFKKKRVECIKNLINENYDIAILDDGFQDFSIKKSLSILCFNSKQQIGNGFILPSGPLREKLSSIKRASCILINGEKDILFENQILKFNPYVQIFYFKYELLIDDHLRNKKIVAFAGIANPNNFFDLLKDNKLKLIQTFSFPDHHDFSFNELEKIRNTAIKEDAILITTEKDYYRIGERNLNINFAKLNIKFENFDKFKKFIITGI